MQDDAWTFPEIGFDRLTVHPRYLVGRADHVLLDLYAIWSAGGMGGGALPCAGGAMDQPACVMESFKIIAGAYAVLRRKPGNQIENE